MHQKVLGSLVVTLISHLQCDIFYILKLQESTQVHATGCTFSKYIERPNSEKINDL